MTDLCAYLTNFFVLPSMGLNRETYCWTIGEVSFQFGYLGNILLMDMKLRPLLGCPI